MTHPAALESIEQQTADNPQWTVIWLHGLGADGSDFVPMVPQFSRPDWPALRFVFPHAPIRAVTINGGAKMRAWYDIRDFDLSNRADGVGVAESIAQIDALIEREAARGVPAKRIVLGGFSQGGAIALAAGIGRVQPFAGIVALSTYLPLGVATLAGAAGNARKQPIFMAHGLHDPVVPYTAGKRSRDMLRNAGFEVAWHAWPMQHEVCAPEIQALADWLQKRFAAA